MGVLDAHGLNKNQICNYNSICSLDDFSVAEYYRETNDTIESFSHTHEEYEFILPIKTIPLLIYNKANYMGEVGFAYPVNPFVRHGLEFPLNDSHCIDITISRSYLDELKKEMGLDNKYFYTRFNVPQSFISLIRKYQTLYNNAHPDEIILNGLKKIITTQLIELGLELNEDNRRPEKTYRKSIRNIILYMYNNFHDKNLSIENLSEMSGFSVAYFTKSFKSYMNEPPISYLNKLRISEAKSLMTKKQFKLLEISDMVGYINLSTFTEAFKKVTGFTPSEYKRKYINS